MENSTDASSPWFWNILQKHVQRDFARTRFRGILHNHVLEKSLENSPKSCLRHDFGALSKLMYTWTSPDHDFGEYSKIMNYLDFSRTWFWGVLQNHVLFAFSRTLFWRILKQHVLFVFPRTWIWRILQHYISFMILENSQKHVQLEDMLLLNSPLFLYWRCFWRILKHHVNIDLMNIMLDNSAELFLARVPLSLVVGEFTIISCWVYVWELSSMIPSERIAAAHKFRNLSNILSTDHLPTQNLG